MIPHIVVMGSLNMDFVVRVAHLPSPGETALGKDFRMVPGGKGATGRAPWGVWGRAAYTAE